MNKGLLMKHLSDSDINQIVQNFSLQEVDILLKGLIRTVEQEDTSIPNRYYGFLRNAIKEYKDDH